MDDKQLNILNQPPLYSLSSILGLVNKIDSDPPIELGDPVKILFLRNFTIESIEPHLKYHFYRSGLSTKVFWGGYDTIQQDVLSPDLNKREYEIIVVALLVDQFIPDHEISNWSVDSASDRLFALYDLIRSQTDSIIVINQFLRPLYLESGFAGAVREDSLSFKISQLNHRSVQYAAKYPSQFFVVDCERLVMRMGESNSIDKRLGYLAKAPFKQAFLGLYAEEIAKVGRALKGKSKKCLILDCDNTLWGGIVGEEELHGIALDRNEYPGKAFYDFQKSVLKLFESGVLIALCSKNNENDVWDVLENHPHCLIKKDHLAAYRINWDDKANNIVEISEELNLGIDSFVFVDDSDVECHLVSQLLPEITVRQVPSELSEHPTLLLREGLFDTLTFSQEDKFRTEMYRSESKRRKLSMQIKDINTYLASLEIKAIIHLAKEHEIPRIAQLTQKTNQFNLTTKRYSEGQIRQFINNPDSKVFTLTVKDKFGDLGLTGILIAERQNDCAKIGTLLLSCRVLGRKVEIEFIHYCIQQLSQEWNPKQWKTEYIPTRKNPQVSDLWEKFGFSSETLPNGTKTYQSDQKQLVITKVPFIETIEE